MLKGLNILLGITGGIAAYKALDMLRLLNREGAEVWCVMTRSATEFVRPLAFQALSRHLVRTDLFSAVHEGEIEHISLADLTQAAIVAPATANIIGKMAGGIADDMLSTILLAVKAPLVVCPAMNVNMYNHAAVQDNLRKLIQRGAVVVEPQEGELACGWEGKGRLADAPTIVEALKGALSPKDLAGQHILVSAGPTREYMDPVRFLSNRSSGKMGYAIACVAARRGAQVTLVSGPTQLKAPPDVELVFVESAEQMRTAVMENLEESTVVIKAAAVTDFRPERSQDNKIKKDLNNEKMSMDLTRTPDILAEIGARKDSRIVVGFAAETKDLLQHAEKKIRSKNLDLVVANDVSRPDSGFEADTNHVIIMDREGDMQELPLMSKEEIASAILDRIAKLNAQVQRG